MTTTRGLQRHDPRHQAETDLQEKGLRAGSVGLVGGMVLGISSVAPAYALTATISILVYSLGIMICFYYGLVAFSCIWSFRRELTRSSSDFVYKLLFPLLGGLGLALVFFITLRDSASPDYGSGATVLGVGLVLILGLGLIASRLFFMLWQRSRDPAFFRGETLVKDTPALVVED
jgi:hypothetical protein